MLKGKIQHKILSAVCSQIGLLGFGDQILRLRYNDDSTITAQPRCEGDPEPRVVIVSRAACIEVRRDIPAATAGEAYKIAKLMPITAPYNGVRKVSISGSAEDNFSALITIVDPSLTARIDLQRPGVALIPISWLMKSFVKGQSGVLSVAGDQIAFASSANSLTTVAIEQNSAAAEALWIRYGDDETDKVTIDQSEFFGGLLTSLRNTKFDDWRDAVLGNSEGRDSSLAGLPWVAIAKVTTTFAMVYLLATSVLLFTADRFTSWMASSESSTFEQALSLKAKRNVLTREQELWVRVIGPQPPSWAAWPPLLEVWEDDVIVSSIQYSDGEIEVFFMAPDGPKLLTNIIENPYVSNARFGVAVRKDPRSNLDRFSLVWSVSDSADSNTEG